MSYPFLALQLACSDKTVHAVQTRYSRCPVAVLLQVV